VVIEGTWKIVWFVTFIIVLTNKIEKSFYNGALLIIVKYSNWWKKKYSL